MKAYILSNRGTWLFRFENSAFGSKWCGLWDKWKKYLDYWAFKIDGNWLSPETFIDFKHEIFRVTHFYDVGEIVKENIYISEKYLAIELEFERKRDRIIELEVGVDIRYRDYECIGPREKEYSVRGRKDFVEVYCKEGKIIFGTKGGFLVGKEKGEWHFPGRFIIELGYDVRFWENPEYKFIPGIYTIRTKDKKVLFEFFIEKPEKKNVEKEFKERIKKLKHFKSLFRSNVKWLEELFNLAVLNIEFLKDDLMFAGFPYFNQYWVRDFIFNSLSLIHLGMFEFYKKCAKNLIEENIPTVVEREAHYYADDIYPLFLISAAKYYEFTGDKSILDDSMHLFDIFYENSKDFIYKSFKRGSWMDTIDREYPIEIQALWSFSFKKVGEILENKEMINIGRKIEKKIEEKYFDGNFLIDDLENRRYSCNAIFAILFCDLDEKIEEKTINVLLNKFLTDFGVRTGLGGSSEYHNGSCWPFITILFSAALFKHGRIKEGLHCLKILHKLKEKQCYFGINEYFDASSGKPLGCFMQGWSIIPVIWVIDEYLMGIKVEKGEKVLLLNPGVEGLVIERRVKTKKKFYKLRWGK